MICAICSKRYTSASRGYDPVLIEEVEQLILSIKEPLDLTASEMHTKYNEMFPNKNTNMTQVSKHLIVLGLRSRVTKKDGKTKRIYSFPVVQCY